MDHLLFKTMLCCVGSMFLIMSIFRFKMIFLYGRTMENFKTFSVPLNRNFERGYYVQIKQTSLRKPAYNFWNAIDALIGNHGVDKLCVPWQFSFLTRLTLWCQYHYIMDNQ